MSMLGECKEFSVKGNVVDMAVGIIIGVAFGKTVSSFVAAAVLLTEIRDLLKQRVQKRINWLHDYEGELMCEHSAN